MSKGKGTGSSPNSRAALMRHRKDLPAVHGMFSRTVQVTGVPRRKVCPYRTECECDVADDVPCPVLTEWAAAEIVELIEAGASEATASQAVRLMGVLRQGYSYLAEHGAFRFDRGEVFPQPALKTISVAENSLARLLRDGGLNRALPSGAGLTQEGLAEMHKRARRAEEAEDDD